MLLLGLNKTTLLDYPGRVAATVFTGGCNFRCPYCHNGGLVLKPFEQVRLTEEEILFYLEKRKTVLKGVCITGGEPTLQDDLPDFLYKIKKIGYDIKLDTNGYAPVVLRKLVLEGLIDYVAMDIKSSPEAYRAAAGVEQLDLEKIRESAAFLKQADIDFEFRTTIVKELHQKEELLAIAKWIRGCPRYFLQQYQDSGQVIGTGFHAYTAAEMKTLEELMNRQEGLEGRVFLRGVG